MSDSLSFLTPMTFHLIGFLCLWLGMAMMFVSVAIQASRLDRQQSFSSRTSESLDFFSKVLKQAFNGTPKSRLNHLGQILAAIGISVEMFAGGYWLVTVIIAKQAAEKMH